MTSAVAIYTRCDHRYFPGLVALLNSLRRAGISHPVYLVDTGLTSEQLGFVRDLADIRVFRPRIAHYALDRSKAARYNTTVFAGLEIDMPPERVIVHLDADAVVLQPLDDLVGAAIEHGFAATGEIPPSTMKTHFWGMPDATGRALVDVTTEQQRAALDAITDRFGPLDDEVVTFNSGIWAARRDYYESAAPGPGVRQTVPPRDLGAGTGDAEHRGVLRQPRGTVPGSRVTLQQPGRVFVLQRALRQ